MVPPINKPMPIISSTSMGSWFPLIGISWPESVEVGSTSVDVGESVATSTVVGVGVCVTVSVADPVASPKT